MFGKAIDDYSFFNYDVHEALHLSEDEKRSLTDLTRIPPPRLPHNGQKKVPKVPKKERRNVSF